MVLAVGQLYFFYILNISRIIAGNSIIDMCGFVLVTREVFDSLQYYL